MDYSDMKISGTTFFYEYYVVCGCSFFLSTFNSYPAKEESPKETSV